MKKIMMTAVAGSALMLSACGDTAPEASQASPAAEATMEAASSDAGTATDAGSATGDETTSGGINPSPKS